MSAQEGLYFRAATHYGQPHALGRFAERSDGAALAAKSQREGNALLLEAFTLYAQAARLAADEEWPKEVWRAWRYRRSTLARTLAADDQMQQVADAYARVLH